MGPGNHLHMMRALFPIALVCEVFSEVPVQPIQGIRYVEINRRKNFINYWRKLA